MAIKKLWFSLIHFVDNTFKDGILLEMVRVFEMNNLVAKHSGKYNKARTFIDRKKAMKRGSVKHKRAFQC